MTDFEAITRKELYLAKIAGKDVKIPSEPITRVEIYLAKLAGQDASIPHPITREEMFLAKLCGMNYTLVPITRMEIFMAKVAGMDVPTLAPITREERLWNEIANAVKQYTITYVNRQEVTTVKVNEGESFTVADEPTPPEGYEFAGWDNNGTIYNAGDTVTPTGDMTFTATFEEVPGDAWAAVFKAERDGTYKEKYNIGDTIPLDLGSGGVINMQIAAFDADELADGSGKAPITWISQGTLKTKHRMNPSLSGETGNYTEGTGAICGWEKSEMRTYLKETVKPLIPETVRNAIKSVKKYSNSFDTTGTRVQDVETVDDVWIPGHREVNNSTNYDTKGPAYNTLFTDANSRKKIAYGDTSASGWWLRSAYGTNYFRDVRNDGYGGSYNAADSYGVALSFCT